MAAADVGGSLVELLRDVGGVAKEAEAMELLRDNEGDGMEQLGEELRDESVSAAKCRLLMVVVVVIIDGRVGNDRAGSGFGSSSP
jgi:hypothetical protein